MSQLDISISFSQFIGLIIGFYFFIFYVSFIINQYWYNKKIRFLDEEKLSEKELKESSNINLIKRILKL
uniref:ATP synthase F0 subunit 8 n=1 Tax=Cladonema pacificum TaxID=499903 RepID=A0A0S2IB08_9CNID|nr:ATP synthase F0 subunit 8 [Cladonema pacificum]